MITQQNLKLRFSQQLMEIANMNTTLLNIIESGKICKVEFTKKDGTTGVVHGRTGVHKHTQGMQRTSDPAQYIMFYDFNKGYRNVNKNTITKVNAVRTTIKPK